MTWSPSSWRSRTIRQQPSYADPSHVERVLEQVRALPPLVHHGEVLSLRRQLAEAGQGKRFLLQGGDCAERFQDLRADAIQNKLKVLLQMSLVLTWGAQIPVVRVGRIAGQYAKPRSRGTETLDDGSVVPSYRGDHVNGHSTDAREPDPQRMLQASLNSAATLNYVRALIDGGFADLRSPGHWDLGFVRSSARREAYEGLVDRIMEALRFLEAVGADPDDALHRVDFFTSHEGLLLAYEEAQTAKVGDRWFNLGAHMLWIGDRTRHLDHAHIEYFRGISNPIGVKVGPTMKPGELVELCHVLNPNDELGRLTLITRYGRDKVADLLPVHIRAVQESGAAVVWSCDPMHGNTRSTEFGLKTRSVDAVLGELEQVFDIHKAQGTILGGVHLELTGEDVTECTGGPQELQDGELSRSYQTFCDPRLNYAQSLEAAFRMVEHLRQQ